MSARRDNRIAALQFLYQWSINRSDSLSGDLYHFWKDQEHPRDYYAFAEELIHGVVENLEAVDEVIKAYTQNWQFERVAKIDLAILRLAVFEMKYRRDIPPVVSINEAIDLSKMFSIPDAKRFINGILDQYKLSLGRSFRDAEG